MKGSRGSAANRFITLSATARETRQNPYAIVTAMMAMATVLKVMGWKA